MDDKRKLEVLTILVKEQLRKEFRFIPKKELLRELPNKAKRLGLKPEELMELIEPMVRELVNEMFSKD